MSPQKKAALQIVATGFAFSAVAFVVNGLQLFSHPRIIEALGRGIVFGEIIFVLGCIRLALAKGRKGWLGLLGLLNVVGLALLWFVVEDRATAGPSQP